MSKTPKSSTATATPRPAAPAAATTAADTAEIVEPARARASTGTPAPVQAKLKFEDGVLDYVFGVEARVIDGDDIEIFAGDYLIGSAKIAQANGAGTSFSARFVLDHLPLMEFPAEMRSVLLRTGHEIAASIPFQNAAALLKAVGEPKIKAQLASVNDRAVVFDLALETLPEYARECILHINGADAGSAISTPLAFEGHPASITHEISFPLRALLRDGAYVEITDAATGIGIYASSITWMNIMGPVISSMRQLQSKYDALSSYFQLAQSRMDALANISRDKQLLDRLDMFYFMINDRLDREIKYLAGKIDPALNLDVAASHAAAAGDDLMHRTVHEIDGVGFYEVESDGGAFWRWFGPDVTLFLKEVSPKAHALRLQFGAVGSGVKFNEASGSINGFPILPEFGASPEGYSEVTFPIAPGSVRSDRAIILNLTFKQAHRAPGDARALSAAFVAAQIFAN